MTNTFFEMYQSPEQYDEIYDKWKVLTKDEQKALVEAPKARLYVSVEDIDLIQDALQCMLQNEYAKTGGKSKESPEHRRVMQLGYALEEVKDKLKRRIAKDGS